GDDRRHARTRRSGRPVQLAGFVRGWARSARGLQWGMDGFLRRPRISRPAARTRGTTHPFRAQRTAGRLGAAHPAALGPGARPVPERPDRPGRAALLARMCEPGTPADVSLGTPGAGAPDRHRAESTGLGVPV